MKNDLAKAVICIVGLGYVGLPLAEAFSKSLRVIGFDIDSQKIRCLVTQHSNIYNQNSTCTFKRSTSSTDSARPTDGHPPRANLTFTTDPQEIHQADFIIICVPTPVTNRKEPDLSHVRSAAKMVGCNMKRGAIVILESTVYPGVTEEIVKPVLEAESSLKCGADFGIAYSPQRINPGDKEHTINRITKVVAGMDQETTDVVAELYRKVTPHIFKAKDIRTAEVAKVIENIQRDLNIALMNELALIFARLGISTRDVINVAATKWNFHSYSPGLVGGHCIPVNPYYLVHKAQEVGYHPQIILAGRAINDYMPKYVAEMAVKALNEVGKVIKGSKVLIMGLTYKEDVPDVRESPIREIIQELKEYGLKISAFDPLIDPADCEGDFNIRFFCNFEQVQRSKTDCVIVAVAHSTFRRISVDQLKAIQNDNPILIDVRGIFDPLEAEKAGIHYKTL